MLNVLKKELNISIITSLVYIVLGIVIMMNPEVTINLIGNVIAVLAIVYGIVMTTINLTNIKEESNLLIGIIAIVMGVSLLIYPSSLSILISIALGIWFITSSVTRLKLAVLVRGDADVNWLVILISSIITLIIGISFIFTPLASMVTLTTLSGVLMIVYSIIDLFEIIFIKKNIKTIEKILD